MENITYRTIQGLSFCVYTKEEIKKFSVLEITNPNTFDALGHPTVASLYDPSLGPNERDEFCTSCGLNYFKCPGHIGHINLPLPVYNPVFLPRLYQLLRGTCFYCHRLVAPPVPLYLTLYQLQALDHGLVSLVQDLEETVSEAFSENLSADESLQVVQEKLKSKFDEAVKGISSEEYGKQPALVKSVVDCRRIIVKKFIREQMMGAKGKCPYCKGVRVKMTLRHNTTIILGGRKKLDFKAFKEEEEEGDIKVIDKNSEVVNEELTPLEAKKHLHLLWDNDQVFLKHLYKTLCAENSSQEHPTDMFFMDLLVVPPIKFRRLMVVKSRKFLNPQSAAYNEALKDCMSIKNLMKAIRQIELDPAEQDIINKMRGKSNEEKLHHKWVEMQRHVNEIFDSDSNKLEKTKTPFGIKQILEKKEGLFRKNMMGKRVNYAARSVISPDPYIMVNEIGVPMVFAKKLTFPEPVSHWNVEKLRLAVNNGPDVHPGALLVESEDGRILKLSSTDSSSRRMIANTLLTPPASGSKGYIGVKKVHRHLRNGDMLLLNRQPTLHKPSIMAHKARVLPGEKTLRLHYANCKSYNADFDGDEMNAHFPQSLHGQAEAQNIVGVNHQYLVPKDGTPLSGLIQDHIIAATLLTIRGRFFSRDDYHQLMYSAISFKKTRLKLLPPAIIKPKVLWSGKQIVSSIIINLIPEGKPPPSVEGKTKVSSKNWQTAPARKWKAGGSPHKGDSMSESEVVISAGELLCGVIDKAQIGPTPYSLIHCCYELYGGETSSLLLTALARLFTHYLQLHSGFSLGIEDIMITEEATAKREEIMTHSDKEGEAATCAAFEINPADMPMARKQLLYNYREAHYNRDDSGLKVLDFEMKKVTDKLNNEINDVCIPDGLIKKFPKNSLQLMVQSGAKGSAVNAMQITCLLGQIELEGRRMPLMMNGCSLPSFLPYDSSPGAGGFVMGRFLTGINHQEYFFHCMAGREGLIDTAVKTSRSGYLQRCLIKHLEGITVNYDLTVRDSDGSVIQFLYGEDGLDISKNQLLKENRLHLLVKNYDAAMNEKELATFQSRQTEENPEFYKKKIKKWVKKKSSCEKKRQSPFLLYQLKNAVEKVHSIQQKKHLCSGWIDLDELEKKKFQKKIKKCPDPVTSFLRPNLSFGSVSEQLESIITDYMKKNPHRLLCEDADAEYYAYNKTQKYLPKSKFQSMAYYRAMRALAEPGEAVGLLCAQSIGEPSTQMTLNTFHFAGKGEMNVTLGIPRLREILMTASPNIATPTMDLPLLDVPDVETKAEKLRVKLAPVTLKELLEAVVITEKISIKPTVENHRSYNIKMKFLKHSEYKGVINTTPSNILYFIEHTFIKKVVECLMKKLRLKSSSVFVSAAKANEQSFIFAEARDEDDPGATNDPRKNDKESSDESDGDGDTVSMKSKNRHEQEQEYEDPEEDEKLPESEAENSDQEGDIQIKEEVKSEDEYAENIESHKTQEVFENENVKQCRIADVKSVHSWISYYDFDEKYERWCEFTFQMKLEGSKLDLKTLLEDEINKTYVYQVAKIQEALLVKNPKEPGKMMLKTKGVNFLEIFRYDNLLDINKVYSNNIHSISLTYGIEAAARAIVHEIVNVFALYGIEVDPRHLSLLADYMTSSGVYQPCNRNGMESNASPLQQMTFETTKNYMVEAMLMGSVDNLKSPSANIVVGQLVGAGTGCFSVSSGRLTR